MTIYVDNFAVSASVTDHSTGRTHRSRWSHLFSSEIDQTELHEFAQCIGLRREWFQPGKHLMNPDKHDPVGDHYDVTTRKRRAAIDAGAVAVTLVEAGELWAAKRRSVHALNAAKGDG